MQRWLTLALLVVPSAAAQQKRIVDTPSVTYVFAQPCNTVRPAALAYFQQEDFALIASDLCKDCVAGSTKHLHDAAGHRLLNNGKIIDTYTTYSRQYEKPSPVSWIAHTHLHTDAALSFMPEGSGCEMSLHFKFGWYGAELWLGIPIEGDYAGAYSNGKLEAAYLLTLQQQIKAREAPQSLSIH